MPKVKICGITNIIDAKNSLTSGADLIGFINIKESKRYVTIEEITEIFSSMTNFEIKKSVLVSDETSVDSLINICTNLGIKILQLYGSLSTPDISKLRLLGYTIIRPVLVSSTNDIEDIKDFDDSADFILLDTKSDNPKELGGTGKVFDWDLFLKAKETMNTPLLLSGGLNNDNIDEALAKLDPDFIDVSSGLEQKPGIKSLEKIKKFIAKVKNDQLVSKD